ncbi:MAG: sigma-54-dependent Fis family transcriptional regulator [Gemmatimonadetes bacterium]|nr:MAG: sigma-54-dependent Fis family transcriptional regulator [Gemmatimonadota bacterium]
MNILIIDDEANLRRMLGALLRSEDYSVAEAATAEEGIRLAAEERPEVILLDLALPGMSGLDALPRLRDALPGTPVVMMSGQATLSDAVKATKEGAFHFIEKPLTPEAVLLTVQGALEVSRARDLARALREELGPDAQLVGESAAMERVRDLIRRVAPTDARVLITGESGTGKELVASAIHGLSPRRGGPFVRVNSAAIPRDLVESEMFGHEKGAFTGAGERRRGRFELAHGGTLFLDEVGDLGAEAQAKLLRALEAGVIERVGGTGPIAVDVRVIAATNRDLREAVEEGEFREDLLFRLEVVPIHLPPLRERREDIRPLVYHALERLRRRYGMPSPNVTDAGMQALVAYDWPGNVRELLNVVERLVILGSGVTIDAPDVRAVLPAGRGAPQAPPYVDGDPRSLRQRLEDYERALIRGALDAAGGNIAEAGRRLRTDRANLYRRMKRLGLRGDDEDGADARVDDEPGSETSGGGDPAAPGGGEPGDDPPSAVSDRHAP